MPPGKVTQYKLPELMQKMLPRLHVCSASTATNLHNWLFDWRARSGDDAPAILHFVNTLGVGFAKRVRSEGGITICDSRQVHPLAQNKLIAAEESHRGVKPRRVNRGLTERMLAELEESDRVIVPSTFARRTFVEQGIDPNHISVIPYGVDTSWFPPKVQSQSNQFKVLFVGTLGLGKGVLYLLEALKQLKLPRTRLICIGNMEEGFEKLVQPYKNDFLHLPNVPKVQLKKYYQAADVFVLPSLADSYALVVLEAAATGLPIITTSSVGSCDALHDGKSGLVVPPADANALAAAILRLYESPSLRNEMTQFNFGLSRTFSWDYYKQRLILEYTQKFLRQEAA